MSNLYAPAVPACTLRPPPSFIQANAKVLVALMSPFMAETMHVCLLMREAGTPSLLASSALLHISFPLFVPMETTLSW